MPTASVVPHEARAGHVEVVTGIIVVRIDLRNELGDEGSFNPCFVQHFEIVDYLLGLPCLVSSMDSV